MNFPRGPAHRPPAASGAGWSRFDPLWIFPAVALAAPLFGGVSASMLQACLVLGAATGLLVVGSAGALWALLVWGGVTVGLGGFLAFRDAPNGQSLTVVVMAAAAAQGLALLGLANPASTAGWRARGRVLLSLAGPLALIILALRGAPDWRSVGAAVAVALDLAALPLAAEARRRARS